MSLVICNFIVYFCFYSAHRKYCCLVTVGKRKFGGVGEESSTILYCCFVIITVEKVKEKQRRRKFYVAYRSTIQLSRPCQKLIGRNFMCCFYPADVTIAVNNERVLIIDPTVILTGKGVREIGLAVKQYYRLCSVCCVGISGLHNSINSWVNLKQYFLCLKPRLLFDI